MNLAMFSMIYNCMRHEVMGSGEKEVARGCEGRRSALYTAGYVKRFNNEMVTTSIRIVLLECPGYVLS